MFKILIFLVFCYYALAVENPTTAVQQQKPPQTLQQKLNRQFQITKKQITDLTSQLAKIQFVSGYKLAKNTEQQSDNKVQQNKQNKMLFPLNIKKCNCYKFSQQQLSQFQSKLNKIQKQIDSISKQNLLCKQCNLEKNINQQKIKIQPLAQAINQLCCSKVSPNKNIKQNPSGLVDLKKSFFKNNLQAPNWRYGLKGEIHYKYQMFLKSSQYNLTTCPLKTPFVNEQKHQCYNCQNGEAYNLETQKCEGCLVGQVFDAITKSCIKCSQEHFYDKELFLCIDCNKVSSDKCLNWLIGHCPVETPFYNKQTKKCEKCQKFTVYDPKDHICKHTNYIGMCPEQSPYYNLELNRCQPCAQGKAYNPNSYLCDQNVGVRCLKDQFYSYKTKTCKPLVKNCTDDQYFDEKYLRCISIRSKCKDSQSYDEIFKKCVSKSFITSPYVYNLVLQSQQFKKYIELYQRIKKSYPKVVDCPPNKPYLNIDTEECIKCSQDKPLFNLDKGQCTKCSPTSTYMPTKYKCEQNTQNTKHMLDLL